MNAKQKTDQPQIDQPSREAMAGKLQIYADRVMKKAKPRRAA
jgi:hypothetical protein